MAKKIDNELLSEDTQDAAGGELRVYELGFHLDPELPQEEVKKTFQTIRDRIAGVGSIVAEGEPAKIPLAYTISRMETTGRRDFDSAHFSWIAYETDAVGHEEIATMAREESRIIRFLDIRSDKEAAQHSAEIHEIFQKVGVQPLDGGDLEDEAPVEAEAPAEETKEDAEKE